MFLRQIFDPALAQYAYIIGCQRTGEALIIDPERDIQRYIDIAQENDLRITAVAETHIHADFVSGAREFINRDPGIRLYVSDEGGPDWTYQWTKTHHHTTLLKHGDTFKVGNILIQAIHTPGHTPEHMCYLITDYGASQPIAMATGDFLFVGDVGRPDLLESAAGFVGTMEPSARRLRKSLVERLAPLPGHLQILPAHGAGSACGKSLGAVPTSTLGYERLHNHALRLAIADEEAFIKDILSGQPEPPPYFATMKRVNRDGIAVTGGTPQPPHLTGTALAALNLKDLRILDTRRDRDAFCSGHVTGALHAPLGGPYFSICAGSYLYPEDKILLVVQSAQDVQNALNELYRIGFDNVIGWCTHQEATAAALPMAQVCKVDFEKFDKTSAFHEGVILDVRSTVEFEKGHIDGARHIPYTHLRERLAEVPDKKIYVHCGTGRRASLAASFLAEKKWDVVFVDGVCADCERIALQEGVIH